MPELIPAPATFLEAQSTTAQKQTTSDHAPDVVADGSASQHKNGIAPDADSTTLSADTAQNPWSVQSVLSSLPSNALPALSPQPTTPVPFFHLLERLKTSPRAGWVRLKVPTPESISDHMYRMSLICLLAPSSVSKSLDVGKCMRLALVHDMAESLVGDITPVDGVPKDEKERRERETMEFFEGHVLGGYDGGEQGKMLRSLWEEYEAGETKEARFVKDVDKLELLLQMMEYEKRGNGEVDLGEFVWVRTHIKSRVCREWAEEIMEERRRFWKGVGRVPKNLVLKDVGGGKEAVVGVTVANGAPLTYQQEWDLQGEEKGVVVDGTPEGGSGEMDGSLGGKMN